MAAEIIALVVPIGTAIAAAGSAVAAWRAAGASGRTAAAAEIQAGAAHQQAAASTQQAIASQEQARARSAEIGLAEARLRKEIAPDARAQFDVGLQLRMLLTDAWWQGPGAVDFAAQGKVKPKADPAVQACVSFYRNMLQQHRTDFALFLGVDSEEWAGLEYLDSMLRMADEGGAWLAYDSFHKEYGGILALTQRVSGAVRRKLVEHQRYLRAPLDPPGPGLLTP